MRVGRTQPPAASPISWSQLFQGLAGWCLGNREVERFSGEIRDRLGVEYCFLTSSGTAALTIILGALKELAPGKDEVIIPAFTCYSVPSAIVRAGLRVRPCDIDPETLDFDFEKLATMLDSPNLLAIVPNHLFGVPADMKRLGTVIDGREITIIEDAAQAFGGSCQEGMLGLGGDVALFSLGRGKAFSTVEGGIIVTRSPDLANTIEARIEELSGYHFYELLKLVVYAVALIILLHPSLFWLPRALPFLKLGETRFSTDFKIRRMSGLQAGMARGWEKRLVQMRHKRAENARNWIRTLNTREEKHFGAVDDAAGNFIRFPWIVSSHERRDEILKASARRGLGIAATYPDSVSAIPEVGTGEVFPAASRMARTLITLPVHELLRAHDIGQIVDILCQEAAVGRQEK